MPDLELMGQWVRLVVAPSLASVVVAAFFSLLRRYIRRLDDQQLRELLLELVRAAEQIYGPGRGAQKRQYVTEQLRHQGLEKVAEHTIEAAVYQLKRE